ncbi:MAG: serine/threonine-protein kinase [Isosphaeraceae bacterium]
MPPTRTKTTASRGLELRQFLRRFVDVCNAVEYAHSRGVLHRDIKPANVILGKHGETLVVDWGLAKALGRADPAAGPGEHTLMLSSASGTAETLPGLVLGTPVYMSPEQAAGKIETLGPRSDVYSLGATLYCLLTGRSPFQGDEVSEVLRKVQHGEFPPPRLIDPSIDAALEAVCLKAMALKPEDRYASSRALAEDVERWAADEPVSAWKEPWTRALQRWLTRHRTAVTGAAAAVLVGVVGLTAVLAVQSSANAQLTAALNREKSVSAELSRTKDAVQARYDLAVDAVKMFYTGVSEDFLLKEEKFKDLRDRLLKSASDFYGKLSALMARDTDLASRRALARSNFDLADLTDKIGNKEEALKIHQAVLAAREALAAEPGAGADLKVDVAKSLIAVGALLDSTNKTPEALAASERARQLLAPGGIPPADASARLIFALSLNRTGWYLHRTGRSSEGLRALEQSRDLTAAIAAEVGKEGDGRRTPTQAKNTGGNPPSTPAEARPAREVSSLEQIQESLAVNQNNIGIVLAQTGRPVEALRAYRAAQEIRERLARDHPAETRLQSDLAVGYNNIGAQLNSAGRQAEAQQAHEAARAIREKLVRENPAVTEFQSNLAATHLSLGYTYWLTGKLTEGERAYAQGLAIQQRLVRDNPTDSRFQQDLGMSYINLGGLYVQMGRLEEALRTLEQARSIREKLARDNPEVTSFQTDLANSHYGIAYLLNSEGRPAAALREYEAERAIYERLLRDKPSVTSYQSGLAGCLIRIGNLHEETGRLDEALRAYEASKVIREKLARDDPSNPQNQLELSNSHGNIGLVLDMMGRTAEALPCFQTTRAIQEKQARENPSVPWYRNSVAYSETDASIMLRHLGRPGEARDAAGRAIVLREALVKEFPNDPAYRIPLATSYFRRGEARRDLGDLAGASADLRQSLKLWDPLPTGSGRGWFEYAGAPAALAGLAGREGSGVSAGEGAVEADRAMEHLHRAVEKSYRTLACFRTEDALDPLRPREDFQLLLMDLAMPNEPFTEVP